VLTEDRVPQLAAAAGTDPDQFLLVDARQRFGVERLRPVSDLDAESGPARGAPRGAEAAERAVERLPDHLHAEFGGGAHRPVELLFGHELAVIIVVAAVDTPQFEVVREGVVVASVDAEVLPTPRTLPAEEAVLVAGDAHPHLEGVLVAADDAGARRHPVAVDAVPRPAGPVPHDSLLCTVGATLPPPISPPTPGPRPRRTSPPHPAGTLNARSAGVEGSAKPAVPRWSLGP
jgi:hypothetical protein